MTDSSTDENNFDRANMTDWLIMTDKQEDRLAKQRLINKTNKTTHNKQFLALSLPSGLAGLKNSFSS